MGLNDYTFIYDGQWIYLGVTIDIPGGKNDFRGWGAGGCPLLSSYNSYFTCLGNTVILVYTIITVVRFNLCVQLCRTL